MLTVRGLQFRLSRGEGDSRVLPLGGPFLLTLLTVTALFLGLLQSHWQDDSWLSEQWAEGRLRPQVWDINLDRSQAALEVLTDRPPAAEQALPKVELFLGDNALEELLRDRQLQHPRRYTGAYVSRSDPSPPRPDSKLAFLPREQDMTRAKVASRGLSPHHFTSAKPSLRVKFNKERALGRRYWELQRPEDPLLVTNNFPEDFAREVGLMSGFSQIVRLLLNNKDRGLYFDTYRLGEPLSLANERLPGMYFKGDFFQPNVWVGRQAWKVFGDNYEEGWQQLDRLLALVKKPRWNEKDRAQLDRLLDLDQYAKWSALAGLTGSVHVDEKHNHVYFYSSYKGKLEPVVWDFNSWILSGPHTHIDRLMNRLYILAYHDPRFVHRRNEYLYTWLQGPGSPEAWQERLVTHLAKIRGALEAESTLGTIKALVPLPVANRPRSSQPQFFSFKTLPKSELPKKVQQFETWNQTRSEALKRYLSGARFSLEPSSEGTKVSCYGTVAVKVRSRSGKLKTPHGEFQELLLYPGMSFSALQNDIALPSYTTKPAPLNYQLFHAASDLQFFHPFDGRELQADSQKPALPPGFSLHPWQFPAEKSGLVTLGPGRVNLEEDLILGPEQGLRVEPGTELLLNPGVGLYSQGEVVFAGTAEAPISVQASESEHPFACLGFWSNPKLELRHTKIEGGSIGSARGVTFKGMLNAYGAERVVLQRVEVGQNFQGDDAVNLALSQVLVENCYFRQARSDALDLDACEGEVLHCSFEESGNDGLDLSSCRLRVDDCRFIRCGDKGVSVGEATKAILQNCFFEACVTGVEVKDRSQAKLLRSQIQECRVGLRAYRKKWSFVDGGLAEIDQVEISASTQRDVEIDATSRLFYRRSQFETTGSEARAHPLPR